MSVSAVYERRARLGWPTGRPTTPVVIPPKPVAPPTAPPPKKEPAPESFLVFNPDGTRTPRSIIAYIAAKHKVAVGEVLQGVRKRKRDAVVNARWEAIEAVKREHPSYNCSRLGRLFNMHSTSVLLILKNAGINTALPKKSEERK